MSETPEEGATCLVSPCKPCSGGKVTSALCQPTFVPLWHLFLTSPATPGGTMTPSELQSFPSANWGHWPLPRNLAPWLISAGSGG